MNNNSLIGSWVRRFLLEYLIIDRNLAHNTQVSYRDTLVLLLPFLSKTHRKSVDSLTIDDLSPTLVRQFLEYLEKDRGCGGATRNLRLATIHSLANFIGMHNPEQVVWCTQIRAIPFRKTAKSSLNYLDKPEIDVLLKTPDQGTTQGRRDYALLLFLYNTGARVDEAAHLRIADVTWGNSSAVHLIGKGNKARWRPLWKQTVDSLKLLTAGRNLQDCVFLNRLNQPLTRFGIYSLVNRNVLRAIQTLPSLAEKRISPHCIRHTCAVHLLRAGVDINTIRAWLGHVSLDTTNIYAEADLEMKANPLTLCDLPPQVKMRLWHNDPGIIGFLKSI